MPVPKVKGNRDGEEEASVEKAEAVGVVFPDTEIERRIRHRLVRALIAGRRDTGAANARYLPKRRREVQPQW